MLAVVVDSRERDDIPPFGHVVDYLTYGGIYREALPDWSTAITRYSHGAPTAASVSV